MDLRYQSYPKASNFSIFWAVIWCITFQLLPLPVRAEIDTVTITWTSQLCLDSCTAGLTNQLSMIKGVSEIKMNQPGGRADLKWKPDVSFTFPPINTAMSMIGLSINELRIKVKGYIQHDGNAVMLVSKPDGSRFYLKSPTNPAYDQYTEQFNIYSYSISPELRAQLLEAEDKNWEVEITGPIFEPERSPPLVLIVERLQVLKKSHD